MMPAGVYYIGDLCYVMSDDEWEEFCELTIKDHECLEGEFQMSDGRRFATHSTKYGDGEYRDQYNNQYSVDAGLIGCIRFEDIKTVKYEDYNNLGRIVEFKTDFETSGGRDKGHNWNGIIHIGGVMIDTDGSYDEEYGE